MDTIKIKIEGYDFEEVASQLVQLSEKDKAVMIQVNPPSNKFGGFALEPAMIMATGVDALAIVLNFLVIYIHGKLLKGFTDGLTKNKAEVTPEHTGKIIIYAPNGLTESAEVQKSTPQEDIRQHIEDLLNFARKYGVSQVIIRASDQSWP